MSNMSNMTHLYLIRHGESLSAAQGVIGNMGLSQLGVTQAERLRDRLAATREIVADALISSTMHRARETAEIIAPALGLPIIFDSDVEEWRDSPEVEGMSEKEFFAKFSAIDSERRPFLHITPESETWVQFITRMGSALNRIMHQHAGKTIVIVCHGGIIDGSFLYFFGLSTLRFPPTYFHTHNTSITHWYQGAVADFPPGWILERYNDCMHLWDIASPELIPWRNLSHRPMVGEDRSASAIPTEAEN